MNESCNLAALAYDLEVMSLTRKSLNRLQNTQRAMERAILGITLRDRVRNKDICKITQVPDILRRVAQLNWRWAGHIVRQDPAKLTNMLLVWCARTTKRRPRRRWRDDIQTVAGKHWMQTASDTQARKHLKEFHIQEWMNRNGEEEEKDLNFILNQ